MTRDTIIIIISAMFALSFLCCDNRNQSMRNDGEIADAPDTSEPEPEKISAEEETKSILDAAETKAAETESDTDTLKTPGELPSEDRLIENLKELFIVEDKRDIKPMENWAVQQMNDTGGSRIIRERVGEKGRKALAGIESISNYALTNKNSKSFALEFQIWKFDNKENAKACFEIMYNIGYDNLTFEKPPAIFFYVSGTDELYFLTTYAWNRIKYMLSAQDKLIDCCFSKLEVRFSDHPFGNYR